MAGQSLLLRHHGRSITGAFAEAGIPAAIVKGPVFAERIYKVPSDRPFTDIDLLTAPENLAKANAVLSSLGFVALTKQVWDKSDSNQEYKWGRSDNPNVLIELHGNLVHYASFRRLLSYSYTDLLRAGGGDPTAPAALLMTAVIHAACGHKFHRLQFAVDIIQAARALPEADIPSWSVRPARSAPNLNWPSRSTLPESFSTTGARSTWRSGSPQALPARCQSGWFPQAAIHNAMSTSGRASHIRRKAFRGLQLLSRVAGGRRR